MNKNIKKEKLNILCEYIAIIKKSWTYNRLTKEERETLEHIFYSEQIKNMLRGNKNQICQILNMIYFVFLDGVGYSGYDWREKEKIPF